MFTTMKAYSSKLALALGSLLLLSIHDEINAHICIRLSHLDFNLHLTQFEFTLLLWVGSSFNNAHIFCEPFSVPNSLLISPFIITLAFTFFRIHMKTYYKDVRWPHQKIGTSHQNQLKRKTNINSSFWV